jgi:thiol-disulfide isomerase/thioredoxin
MERNNIWLILLLFLFLLPENDSSATDWDELEPYAYSGLLVALPEEEVAPEPPKPEPVNDCPCNGTGEVSYDGGTSKMECPCGDNCGCAKVEDQGQTIPEESPPENFIVEDHVPAAEQDVVMDRNALPEDVNVYVWTAYYCAPCKVFLPQVTSWFNKQGGTPVVYEVKYYQGNEAAGQKQGINSFPTVQIVSKERNENGQAVKIWGKFAGATSKQDLINRANQLRYSANHYLQDTDGKLLVPRFVFNMSWGGWIDLDTYRKNCNCAMCKNIRFLQQRRQNQIVVNDSELPDHQQPCPDEVIAVALSALKLTPDDHLCSLGCGDARELISAVKQYGCSAIGVEIDPKRANAARKRVASEGLSSKIHIVEGDARDFDLASNGVTAIYAYLYESLLEELSNNLQSYRTVTPFHQVAGLEGSLVEHDGEFEVWLYD